MALAWDYIKNLRRVGRPKIWQTDCRADWVDMSHSDEYCLIKELKWLKAPKTTKGRSEQLAEIADEENRPRGEYLTEIDRWTCSCSTYLLISRFLLCKHQVRERMAGQCATHNLDPPRKCPSAMLSTLLLHRRHPFFTRPLKGNTMRARYAS